MLKTWMWMDLDMIKMRQYGSGYESWIWTELNYKEINKNLKTHTLKQRGHICQNFLSILIYNFGSWNLFLNFVQTCTLSILGRIKCSRNHLACHDFQFLTFRFDMMSLLADCTRLVSNHKNMCFAMIQYTTHSVLWFLSWNMCYTGSNIMFNLEVVRRVYT